MHNYNFCTQNMQVPFIKMHGLLNDFVIIDQRTHNSLTSLPLIQSLCHRRLGIGCDQLIILEPPSHPQAYAKMRIWNPDGIEVHMCGNALRCVAMLLFEEKETPTLLIETKSGLYPCYRHEQGIKVNMGQPSLDPSHLPTLPHLDLLNLDSLHHDLLPLPLAASIGNPHLVFFVPNLDTLNLTEIGSHFENHPLFLERINVSLAELIFPILEEKDPSPFQKSTALRLKTWERGTGLTPACGSAACCSVFLGIKKNLLGPSVDVHMEGGRLLIEVDEEDHLFMTGPAQFAFQGSISLSSLSS